MSKIDPLLKTLQVRPSPPEALVQAYLIHIADKSDTNFRKILDLKGIRKAEQTQLLDLFSAFRASPNHENLVQNSPFLTHCRFRLQVALEVRQEASWARWEHRVLVEAGSTQQAWVTCSSMPQGMVLIDSVVLRRVSSRLEVRMEARTWRVI
jgi:hypothetical protein